MGQGEYRDQELFTRKLRLAEQGLQSGDGQISCSSQTVCNDEPRNYANSFWRSQTTAHDSSQRAADAHWQIRGNFRLHWGTRSAFRWGAHLVLCASCPHLKQRGGRLRLYGQFVAQPFSRHSTACVPTFAILVIGDHRRSFLSPYFLTLSFFC